MWNGNVETGRWKQMCGLVCKFQGSSKVGWMTIGQIKAASHKLGPLKSLQNSRMAFILSDIFGGAGGAIGGQLGCGSLTGDLNCGTLPLWSVEPWSLKIEIETHQSLQTIHLGTYQGRLGRTQLPLPIAPSTLIYSGTPYRQCASSYTGKVNLGTQK